MTTRRAVSLHVIIPTLGERQSLLDIIGTLRSWVKKHHDLQMTTIVSFNPRSDKSQKVFLASADFREENFNVEIVGPESYQPSTEHHLLWCFRWYRANHAESGAYLWPLSDYDPLIESGFDAMVEYLRYHDPDIFFVNNVWGDMLGQPLPSPAFRVNRIAWQGSASLFFRSVGFEHATSNIGSLVVRGGFLSEPVISMYEATLARTETCAHAWWSFEAASTTDRFCYLGTPIVVNKFNRHHFDHSATWRQNARRNAVARYHSWTVGYLRHLQYYVEKGILSYHEIRTAMLSEPERGILPFLDDILRRLFMQSKLALLKKEERFSEDDLKIIRNVLIRTYPLRKPLIDFLCGVLSGDEQDARDRLNAYKLAKRYHAAEQEHGVFAIIFRNAFYGYHCYEHNLGFVAVLDKDLVHLAYRDLDPVDIYPWILYGPNEGELINKLKRARLDVDPKDLLEHLEYVKVVLKDTSRTVLIFPQLQLIIYSLPERVLRLIVKVFRPPKRVLEELLRLKDRFA